jgi:hypothetical protein
MSEAIPPLHTFVTKLGTARQVSKSRIWIEGKRLVDAGFTVGQYFVKEWDPVDGVQTLLLMLVTENDVITEAPCKVSGKGDKPIIDITGEAVREGFGKDFENVQCVFEPGRICITGAA